MLYFLVVPKFFVIMLRVQTSNSALVITGLSYAHEIPVANGIPNRK